MISNYTIGQYVYITGIWRGTLGQIKIFPITPLVFKVPQ